MAEAQTLADYTPGPVERFGRRHKMEYVGMASVFVVIALLFFGDLGRWYLSLAAMMATFALFLGIKKKTRDHLSASFLLFAAAALARGGLMAAPEWVWPYLFFGLLIFVMEGYLEKPRNYLPALPALFVLWGALDLSWILGLALVALYLPPPLAEKPGWRRRLGQMLALAAVAAVVATAANFGTATAAWSSWPASRLAPGTVAMVLLLGMGIPVLVAVAVYWRRVVFPRRANALLFAFLAPWDERFIALFGLVGAILLSATFLRQSIDSDKLRPLFKHAEWHFFWYVLAVAIWAGYRAF